MPVLLSCHELTKSFDIRPLFENLTLAINAGERVGLIGPNGTGKSTLMKILAGMEQAGGGTRALAKGTHLVYLAQEDRFTDGTTPRAVLTAAVPTSWPEHQREARATAMLERTGFIRGGLDERPVQQLSGGWRKRLSIARALLQEPDLLLMDEPTNHLDLEGIWWLERVLSSAQFTVVMASHDRAFLERAANRIIELNKAYPDGHFASTGGYVTFLAKRAELFANQAKQQDVLNNQVRREVAWLQRGPKAQMIKSVARIEQAEQMQSDLAELKYRNSQHRTATIDFTGSGRRTNDLVVLQEVGKSLGGRELFRDVSLIMSPGTRLGLLGLNGSGKTTFLRLLAGLIKPDTGTVKHAFELKVVYFEQTRSKLDPNMKLRKALCPTGETVYFRERPMHIMAWAKRFLFRPEQLDLEIGKLSGGEQARVLIADLMLKKADLLILDEPTNDLDIPSLEVLEENLKDFPGALAMVTHDRFLLDRVSTQLLALDGKGGAQAVADYAQWEDVTKRQEQAANNAATKTIERPEPPRAQVSSGKGLASKERRELEGLPDKVAEVEARLGEIEAQLADPAVTGDPDRLEKACADLAEAQALSEQLYARWSELEAKAR
jgi:ATP-binding cassette subfamily F protein uup